MRTFGKPLVVLFVLVIVAGCGGSNGGSSRADGGQADQATEQSSDPSETAASGSESAFDVSDGSPLEQLVGAPVNDDEAMNRFYEQLETEAEAATAECMLQQGFQYIPWARTVSPLEASGLQEDSVECAEQFGFGIVVEFSFFDLGAENDSGDQDEYLASLTEGERQAYVTALRGIPSDQNDESGFNSWGGGCQGEAYEAAYAKSPDRVFDLLEDEAMTIIMQFYADPRILETEKAYAACMSTTGYEFENPDKAKVAIASEMGDIVSDESNFVDPWPPENRGEIEMGWNDESAIFSIAGDTLTDDGQALLDGLAAKEREVALVSAECFGPQRETQLEVQFEYEQILVDQLGDQVRAIQAEE